jgi:3',5'-cyclic AMP phosphodiesterase CpdA
MPEFRLTQISDTHLARRLTKLTDNFHSLSEYIDATRPNLVVNSGDVAFDGPTSRNDLDFARSLHDALPVACRYLPGNHDIGDNPTQTGPVPSQPVTEKDRQAFVALFGDDRWRFEAAGWCFIGVNSLVMNSGLAHEAEQFDWLAAQLASTPAPDRNAPRCRSAAGRERPRPSTQGLYIRPHQTCLGALRRLHHFGCAAGADRYQGSRPCGVPLPAR